MSVSTILDVCIDEHEDAATLFNDKRISEANQARAELAALRKRVAELESAQDNQSDSLQAWADLWEHICKRLGYVEGVLLPNTSNFDHMMLSVAISE